MKPPRHLLAPTRRWFTSVIGKFELEEHHLHLLTLAGEALDRCKEARLIIKRDGLIVDDRFGVPRAHPAVAIERDSRLAFARLIRELDLDTEAPAESSRPPALHSARR